MVKKYLMLYRGYPIKQINFSFRVAIFSVVAAMLNNSTSTFAKKNIGVPDISQEKYVFNTSEEGTLRSN